MPYLDRPGMQQQSQFLTALRTRVIWSWGDVGIISHMLKKRRKEQTEKKVLEIKKKEE